MRIAPALAVIALGTLALAGDPPPGLELDLTLKTKGPVQPGEPIEFTLRLVNRSKTATVPVVQPNHGSEQGWREPHVFWTATLVAGGVERPVESLAVEEGEMFVVEWWKDVTKLAPGASIGIDKVLPIHRVFDVQEDGKLRIVAHYAWNRGKFTRGDPLAGPATPPSDMGGMKEVDPYELKSAPAEIEIRRAFQLTAKPKRAFKAGIVTRLSDVLDVRLKSHAGAPLTFDPAEWQVSTDIHDEEVSEPDQTPVVPSMWGKAFELDPGAETTVLAEGPFGRSRDVSLRFPKPGKTRIAVRVRRASGEGPSVRSNWVDMNVEQ